MTRFPNCDHNLWDVVKIGPQIPTKMKNGVAIPVEFLLTRARGRCIVW